MKKVIVRLGNGLGNQLFTYAAAHSFASNTKGGGGLILDTGNVFPEGMTIYGRWTAFKPSAAGVICYFGK